LTDEQADEVTIEAACYSPTVTRVQPGTTVTWTNADSVPHNVVVADSSGDWRTSPVLTQGGSFTHTFESTGTFPYYCSYHLGMVGVVAVGDMGGVEGGSFTAGGTSIRSYSSGAVKGTDGEGDSGMPPITLAGAGALALLCAGVAGLWQWTRSSGR
jgi:hypothetical protein